MTDEQVIEALTAAAAADQAAERGEQAPETPAPSAPQGENSEQAPAPADAPSGEEHSAEEVDPFSESFNPDTLPEELRAGWKQLYAAFTKKTQAVAEERRRLEQYGSPEDLELAIELYGRITDPSNWAQLHSELSEAMQELGLTPAQADAAAAQQIADAQAPVSLPNLDELDDPELAPLAEALRTIEQRNAALEARFQAIEAERRAAEEAAEAERLRLERGLWLQEQVQNIREAAPHYQDEDIKQLVRMAPFFNDDLYAAHEALESYWENRMNRYFASKQTATSPSIQPQPGAGVESTRTEDAESIMDVMEGAVDYIRGLQSQGVLDT